MAETNVAVVSAGVKSILDIGLTLEKMETFGIPVVSIGTDEFPSFYSRESGFASPTRLDTAAEVAAFMHTKWALGISGGVSVANPIPERDEIPAAEISVLVEQALSEMDERGISGKKATPYLLGRIVELSDGESLRANIALIENNARLGAQIAKELTSGQD